MKTALLFLLLLLCCCQPTKVTTVPRSDLDSSFTYQAKGTWYGPTQARDSTITAQRARIDSLDLMLNEVLTLLARQSNMIDQHLKNCPLKK